MWSEELEKKAIAGDVCAMYDMGEAYRYGSGIEEDLEKAFHWYFRASQNYSELKHCRRALFKVAECFRYGIGVAENKEEAFQYYLESAQYEYFQAQFEVAEFYRLGIGTEQDFEEALYWYERSEDNGCEFAKKRVKEMKTALKLC